MSSRVQPRTETVQVTSFSDGDPNHRPTDPSYVLSNPENYLKKLAAKWMEQRGGSVNPGTVYILDQLPAGYAVYERARPGNRAHVDKYLFGHPLHQVFDSPNRFYPHFQFLMEHSESISCSCEICYRGQKPADRKDAPKTSGTRGKPPLRARPKDKDGIPSYFSSLLELFRREKVLERAWMEEDHMDWRTTRDLAMKSISDINTQLSFEPRVGELVLWCHTADAEIHQHPETKEFRWFDPVRGEFGDHPQWFGGVITQGPAPYEPVYFDDILTNHGKRVGVHYSGFRVECLPHFKSEDKSVSWQYSHVPLHHIRPMAFLNETMAGIPLDTWHPTIQSCVAAMGTFSQIDRYRFKGDWPNAYIYSRACASGSEVYVTGDVVRVVPERGTTVTDILHVTDFALKFRGFKPAGGEAISVECASHINADFHGYGYTTDINRSASGIRLDAADKNHGLPDMVYEYGPWYHLKEPDNIQMVSCAKILGRMFEPAAMERWFPEMDGPPSLSVGCVGVMRAKEYAAARDESIEAPSRPFLMCETRAEALDVRTVNGQEESLVEDPRIEALWSGLLDWFDDDPASESIEEGSSSAEQCIDPELENWEASHPVKWTADAGAGVGGEVEYEDEEEEGGKGKGKGKRKAKEKKRDFVFPSAQGSSSSSSYGKDMGDVSQGDEHEIWYGQDDQTTTSNQEHIKNKEVDEDEEDEERDDSSDDGRIHKRIRLDDSN